jgi:hypothetical protein
MRSPQLARCSRDAVQLRRRMGQHGGAALGRGRGGGCEVFRAPPSLGRQLEARQRAERRAASESTVVDALLATDLCPADPATADGLWLCGLKRPGSRLCPPFYGDVTFFSDLSFFYTVFAPPRPAPPRSAPPRAAPPCAAPPAQRRLRLACAAPSAPRCLCRDASRRDASRRDASRGAASARAATPRAATPRTAPPRP